MTLELSQHEFSSPPPSDFEVPLPPQSETPGPVAMHPDGSFSAWPPQPALDISEGLLTPSSVFKELAPAASPERTAAAARTSSSEQDALVPGFTAERRAELELRMDDARADAFSFMRKNGLDPAQCMRPSREYIRLELALLQRNMVQWAKSQNVQDELGFDPECDLAGLVSTALRYREQVGVEGGTTAYVETDDGSPLDLEKFRARHATNPSACLRCRAKRRGCTHEIPCARCVRTGSDCCVYVCVIKE